MVYMSTVLQHGICSYSIILQFVYGYRATMLFTLHSEILNMIES